MLSTTRILAVIALELVQVGCQSEKPLPSTTQSAISKAESEPEPLVIHHADEDFKTGFWSYRFLGARWTNGMMMNSVGVFERPNAAFLTLYLKAGNEGRTSGMMPSVKLLDDEGREYDCEFGDRTLNLRSLNPGVSAYGHVICDVPADKTYLLKLSGGIQSEAFALVQLSFLP